VVMRKDPKYLQTRIDDKKVHISSYYVDYRKTV
jgi:hypothetical protein